LVAVVAFAIYSLLNLPMKKYTEAFIGAYADKTISPEEKDQLDRIAKLYRISDEKRKIWEQESIARLYPGETPPVTQKAKQEEKLPPPPSLPPLDPSLEAKQHVQQGMTYVSLAKQNPGKANENYDNAVLEFSRAIEQSPCYAAAYANRAVAYLQQKKFNKSLDDLNKAADCDPQDKITYYNLASLYSLQNQRDRAMDALDRALELGFNDYDALRSDQDLKNIRQDREFRKILEKHKIFLK
jgi:tetratricopeptide (TPR) repeat protein